MENEDDVMRQLERAFAKKRLDEQRRRNALWQQRLWGIGICIAAMVFAKIAYMQAAWLAVPIFIIGALLATSTKPWEED